MPNDRQFYIGLISGTSVDGIDAVLTEFIGDKISVLDGLTFPIPTSITQQIKQLMLPGENEIDRMGIVDQSLGELFAESALTVLEKNNIRKEDISAIGSHGQTIRHRPSGSLEKAFTLQIGDPNMIAHLTGITTVADFRRRDMAAGGEAAPLVPAFHAATFSCHNSTRIILNIGGISNITVISPNKETFGFDTGPGNALMDDWIFEQRKLPYDKNGEWAKTGTVNETLLNSLLADEYFQKPHPKSTGREFFSLPWLKRILEKYPALLPSDIQRTLLEFTAASVANDIKKLTKNGDEVYVCGGGAFNTQLMLRLSELMPDHKVDTTARLDVDPNWVEGAAFAWLARQTMNKKPGNLPAVTGAERAVILGGIYQA